jgi:hypothetical protein
MWKKFASDVYECTKNIVTGVAIIVLAALILGSGGSDSQN